MTRLLELILKRNLLMLASGRDHNVQRNTPNAGYPYIVATRRVRLLLLLRQWLLLRRRVAERAARVQRAQEAVPARARAARRFGVRPLFRARGLHGMRAALLPLLRGDPEKFFDCFRMTPSTFYFLLRLIEGDIELRAANAISPEEQLAVALRYLATGTSMRGLQFQAFMAPNTVSEIVERVCPAIWDRLSPEVLPPISRELWERTAEEFEDKWNFPNCCGAMDGKHVDIVALPNTGSAYFNYKKQHSVVMLAVVDASYKFIVVDAGARGRRSDGGVLQRSAFGEMMARGELDLPPARNPRNFGAELPHCFVGDGAFPLRPDLLKPFSGTGLGPEKTIFNYRLSRARRISENAFGIMTAQWRIMRRRIQARKEVVTDIVLACAALHNLNCMVNSDRYIPTGYADSVDAAGRVVPGTWRLRLTRENSRPRPLTAAMIRELIDGEDLIAEGQRARLLFSEYFLLHNPLPWQWSKVPPAEEWTTDDSGSENSVA